MSVVFSKNLGKILTQVSTGIYSEFVPASTLAMVELATDMLNQLRDPILINFTLLNSHFSDFHPHCVYWDTDLLGWSTDALNVYDITDHSITCSSAHLSTFMVLIESVTAVSPIDVILNYVIFGIGGIALICLLMAIILLALLCRKLLENDIYIAQFNLGISIIFLLISHIIGLLKYSLIQEHCNFIAAIVYFFSLSSTTCFLADGAAICFKLILPKVKRRIHFLLLILGWIVPVPLTVFRVIFDLDNLGVKDEYCWLSEDSSITWSMIEPILVIIFITLIALLISLISCCLSRNIELVRVAKFAFSSHFLLALFIIAPWVVNIINVYVSVPYYRWVYTSMIALLGFLFFMLYAIRNKSIRSKLRLFKYRSKKDLEIEQEFALNGDPPSRLLDSRTNLDVIVGFQNPLYDKLEGATPYLKEKLVDEYPNKGYSNPLHENIYAELNTNDETNVKDPTEGTPQPKRKLMDEYLEKGYDNPVCENIYFEETTSKSNTLDEANVKDSLEEIEGATPFLKEKSMDEYSGKGHDDSVSETSELNPFSLKSSKLFDSVYNQLSDFGLFPNGGSFLDVTDNNEPDVPLGAIRGEP